MRIARVKISKEFFEMCLKADFGNTPNSIVTSDAPKDLEVIGIAYSVEQFLQPTTFDIYVRSETFQDVPEGAEIPRIKPFLYTKRLLTEEEIQALHRSF